MLRALWKKFMESTVSVLPVTLIVLLLNFTPVLSLTATETVVFLCSAVALIIGMALFNLGADIAMTPMGEQIGSGLSKSGRFKTLLLICFARPLRPRLAGEGRHQQHGFDRRHRRGRGNFPRPLRH